VPDQRLPSILELAVDAIVSIDEHQRIVGFNKGAESLFGYLAEEVLGKPLDALLPNRVVEVHRGHVAGFAEAPETARLMGERREIFGRRKDGTEFPAEASIAKVLLDGRPTFTAILRDATDRRRAEEELRSRAAQQAAVAELGQQALTGRSAQELMQEVAVTLVEVLGAHFAEVLELHPERDGFRLVAGHGWGADAIGTLTEDTAWHLHPGFTLRADEPTAFEDLRTETRFIGTSRLIDNDSTSGISVKIPGPVRPFGLLGVYSRDRRRFTSDDTHFLQALANVLAAAIDRERRDERVRAFLEAAPDATIVADRHGRIVSANAQAEVLFGYPRDDLVGMPVEALVPDHVRAVHAAHRARYETEPRTRPMGAGVNLFARRSDGTEVPVDIMLSPVETDDGVLVVAAVRDATERRRAQAVRDSFLHAVSHELRTPLTTVVGFASMLLHDRETLGDDEARDMTRRLLANAQKLERLLADLLDLDRLSRGVVEPRRRPTVVRDVVDTVLSAVALDEHPTQTDIEPDDLTAHVDPAQLERTIENLAVNVARHTPPGTPVWVRARRGPNGLLIAVEDAGPGVPEAIRQEIFHPFRRGDSRAHSPGTGIGLSLVARFAELHGGRAWVEEREGGGASFRALFPEAD
jgi:protein-histidine pros-kinase